MTYYILSRCSAHDDHFFLRAAEPGEIDVTVPITGASVQVFSNELRRKVEDIEQLNFQENLEVGNE